MHIRHPFWLAPVLVGVLALALRLPHLDHEAHFDELYHVLAARSWLNDRTFAIAEGIYGRTPLFTMLIGGTFALFGESLAVARLPSVLAGTLLVVAVFVWTRREAGVVAAWVAALLLALWSEAIEISQFARFYALHGLIVFVGTMAVFSSFVHGHTRRGQIILVLAGAAAFALALSLQLTSLIAIAGVGLSGTLVMILPGLSSSERAWLWAAGFGVVLLLAVILLALPTDLRTHLWTAMFETPLWNARQVGRFWYYHGLLSLSHPLLWSLAGAVAFIAVAHRPRPALFCLIVFAVAFLVHSILAPKHIRYFYYAMPFLFVLAGIAAQDVLPRFWGVLIGAAQRATATLGWTAGRRPAAVLAGLACAFALSVQSDLMYTAAGLAGIYLPPEEPQPSWGQAKPALAPWLQTADVVLTTSELEALYYLGRYDILISKSRVDEVGEGEFDRDFRTGRPVISTPGSVALVMECYPDGLIVSSEPRWRRSTQLDDRVADLIVRRAEEIELSARGMRAYRWKHSASTRQADACARLRAVGLQGAAPRGDAGGMSALGHPAPSPGSPNLSVRSRYGALL